MEPESYSFSQDIIIDMKENEDFIKRSKDLRLAVFDKVRMLLIHKQGRQLLSSLVATLKKVQDVSIDRVCCE
jgi:hypothetical protein